MFFCRQDISVQADDVIVTSTMDSGNGLQVHLYVQHMGGVIPQQALVAAIEVPGYTHTLPFIDIHTLVLLLIARTNF